MKFASLLLIVVLSTGCASVMNDTTHTMRIETKTQEGELVSGAECTLTNDKSVQTIKSGDVANVRRASHK